jgi:hypothetical protein
MRTMIIAAALATAATPAVAQNIDLSGGLVDVTIQDVSVLNNFLNDAQIAALNDIGVPITVQVPIGIAANVCNVSANVIAEQNQTGRYACDAENATQAFANQVIRQQGLRQTR